VRVDPAEVRLVPWSEDDLPLLIRLNAPEMTEHLGGPESAEQVLLRHQRYVVAARTGIVHGSDRESVLSSSRPCSNRMGW